MNGGSTRLGCSMHHEYSTAVCVCVPVAHRFFFPLEHTDVVDQKWCHFSEGPDHLRPGLLPLRDDV